MDFLTEKDRVVTLFDRALEQVPTYGDEFLGEHLREERERLADGRLTVVVCGEFKTGKSSLINGLLGEFDLFPVDVAITTSVVTTITKGLRDKITVHYGEPGKEHSQEILREDIPDYVTEQGNPNNLKQVRLLAIESTNPRLVSGLTIVDTPGIGSVNLEHTNATYAFLRHADVAVFVNSAQQTISTDDLAFVTEQLQGKPSGRSSLTTRRQVPVIYVLTHIDEVAEYEETLASNRAKLAEQLQCDPAALTMVAVSNKHRMVYLKDGNSRTLRQSHFEELERIIWEKLSRDRGRLLLSQAVTELAQATGQMMRPLEIERLACDAENASLLADISAELTETRERLNGLLSQAAPWHGELQEGVVRVSTEILELAEDGHTELKRQAEDLLGEDALVRAPDQLARRVQLQGAAMVEDVWTELGAQAGQLYGRLRSDSGLDLDPFDVSRNQPQDRDLDVGGVRTQKTSRVSVVMDGARNANIGVMTGVTVGGVGGFVFGGIIGFFCGGPVGAAAGAALGAKVLGGVGAAVGLKHGIERTVEQVRQREVSEIRRDLVPLIRRYLDDNARDTRRGLRSALEGLRKTLSDSLIQEIKRERQTIEAGLRALVETEKRTRAECAERSRVIEMPLRKMREIQSGIERLLPLLEPPTSYQDQPTTAREQPTDDQDQPVGAGSPQTGREDAAQSEVVDWA